MLSIIVAVASNWAIGKENNLLWHISEDLKFFKRTTLGSPIIMGYNTFLSLGSKALPKRRNIVINRNVEEEAPVGVEFVRSLDEAVALVKDEPQAFIIGGGRIYAAALDIVDQLYVTHVDTAIEDADTFFPDLTQTKWRQSETTPWSEDPESGLRYRFAIYTR
ncbi:MAG: dihydrofolate reductase [Bacteroidales bacterium]|nr:dihydrofolate reductase [Bacteroidales bacterium]